MISRSFFNFKWKPFLALSIKLEPENQSDGYIGDNIFIWK